MPNFAEWYIDLKSTVNNVTEISPPPATAGSAGEGPGVRWIVAGTGAQGHTGTGALGHKGTEALARSGNTNNHKIDV
ncbi:MAG TPA: hypothetical protein DC042_00435 [Bacteroidales bacterium]|nr:MAG: hypothetical protein A2017_00045 [Lentisphaerae bacterium GWF2_44_16]HBB90220.1 hypothetical protein [Bacteroidales bacterium]